MFYRMKAFLLFLLGAVGLIHPTVVTNTVATSTSVIATSTISVVATSSPDQFLSSASTTVNIDAVSTSSVINSPSKNIRKIPKPIVSPLVQVPKMSQSTGTLCNGTYWNTCPVGQNLVCPQTGNAYCQLPAQQPQTAMATTTSMPAPATTTIDKGVPYKGQDGNWYYPNAYDANGRNLQVPGPRVGVTANPANIVDGDTTTISWVAQGATSCTMNSSPVLLTPTGSQTTGALTTSTTYTFTCSFADGTYSGGATVNVADNWFDKIKKQGPGIYPIPADKCASNQICQIEIYADGCTGTRFVGEAQFDHACGG